MQEKQVLIVEDDAVTSRLLSRVLEKEGFRFDTAHNGKEALSLFEIYLYPVVVTDIEMPELDGNELISRIRSISDATAIIVTSAHGESDLVIDVMKKGVHDYLLKPINADELIIKVKKALEMAHFRRMSDILEKEKQVRIENQLEWYRWHENMMNRDLDIKDKSLFKNLHTSFNQGAGIGSIMPILDMMLNVSEKDGEYYRVPESLIELARENMKYARRSMAVFSEIEYLEDHDLDLVKVSVGELTEFIHSVIEKIRGYTSKNNHTILVSDPKPAFKNISVALHQGYILKVIEELLMNAMKFSKKETEISVLLDVSFDQVIMSVLSEPRPDEDGRTGIPPEYENLVFEPFYRMGKTLNEEYETLEFGLGLTFSEKIVSKLNGKIYLSNIKDHSDIARGAITKVNAEVRLPALDA